MNQPHNSIYEEPEELPYTANALVKDYWKKYNLLSLDGGGIRGYWSLLVLGRLMEWIAEAEESNGIDHSFSPQPYPDNVSQGSITDDEIKKLNEAENNARGRCRALLRARRYLPCHYFDYICGSSTGALIAILLGRFRMTVKDCMDEYENLGGEIFGKPRFFTQLNFGIIKRTKYKGERLKRVFEDVTARRSELATTDNRITFPSKAGLCKTFVTTLRREPPPQSGASLYLIRSYNQPKRTTPNIAARGGENVRGRKGINYGNAQQFEIWQVARAASAAPFFFEPLKIPIVGSPGHLLFTDGGFNHTNNPTLVGIREIEDDHGANSIGVVVSVGTARKDESAQGVGLRQKMKEIAFMATDPEKVHQDMEEKSYQEGFQYFRLNHPNGLSIELDEWEPKQTPFTKTSGLKTLRDIQNAFGSWAGKPENVKQFRKCAEALVTCRRARATDEAKWERYAVGAGFECHLQGCDPESGVFSNRDQFRDHLEKTHQVPKSSSSREADRFRTCWEYQGAPKR